jgi:pyrimidine operon attenuation protein/uracil phosphoribosyltransferase
MDEVLESVCARQAFLKKHSYLGIDSRFFVILDDVLKDPNIVRYSKGLQNLFANGRHYGIFLMVLLQDPKAIPPMLRENTDIAVVFRQFTRKY